ncbi:hypothetical protein MKX01_036737, partial [Papaver californicum]
LEDFINSGEATSLLDCVRLTAGDLLALADATPPARPGPASAAPNGTAGSSAVAKQNALVPSQGPFPRSSSTNVTQTPTLGNLPLNNVWG